MSGAVALSLGAWSIALRPDLPLLLLAGLAAALLLLTRLAWWRGGRGAAFRLLAGAALLLALLQPSLIEERRDYRDDIALVVVDRSPSQALEDRAARSDAALRDLRSRLERQGDLEVRVVESRNADAAERGTALFADLQKALADIPPQRLAGVIAISDGQAHDVPASAAALALAAPLHLLLTGDPAKGDRRLELVEAPSFGLVGHELQAKIRVVDLGGKGGGTAEVRIRRDGEELPAVAARIGEVVVLPLALRHGGQSVFELAVAAGPEEITMANNGAILTVNGVRDRLRVLLISGEPYPGERFWRNLLKSDPAVDLVHFTILRPPNKQDATPINELALIAFPIDELFDVKLKEFDLIIFDRFQHLGILPEEYFRHIVDYVREGGAVLEAAGPSSAGATSLYRTPMAAIFPAQPTGEVLETAFRPVLTALGRKHPVTAGLGAGNDAGAGPASGRSWGRWFRQTAMTAARGQVLMTGAAGLPLLLLDRVGKGRVAQVTSDQIWLWSKDFEGGGPQAELIRRTAHWLMQEPELEEEDLRAAVIGDRLEIERRSLSEAAVPVRVTAPGGGERVVPLEDRGDGRAFGALPVAEHGLYRLTDGARRAFAALGEANSREFQDPRASPEPMRALIEETGGGIFELAKGGVPDLRRVDAGDRHAGAGWLGLLRNRDYVVTGLDQVALLPPWAALALALGFLLLAWRREGR